MSQPESLPSSKSPGFVGAVASITLWELNRHRRRMSTWVYFLLFFALGMLLMVVSAGGLPGGAVSFGGSSKVLSNSPYSLSMLIPLLAYFGLLVIAPIMGQAVHRDVLYRTEPLFHTTPVSEAAFLAGRFLGAYLILVVIFSSIGLGAWIGTGFPTVQESFLGPNRLIAYVWPYVVSILPNIFFLGAFFFGLAAWTRKMMPVYVGSAAMLIGYLVADGLTGDTENELLASLADPFGMAATGFLTRYWSAAEQSTNLVPLSGYVLMNRCFWVALGIVVLAATFSRFRFGVADRGKAKIIDVEVEAPVEAPHLGTLPTARGMKPSFGVLAKQTWVELRQVLTNVYFVVIALLGVAFVFSIGTQIGEVFGTTTWPVTYQVIDILGGNFGLFMLILITFYSGELVWRERDANLAQIVDALPIPGWLPIVAKTGALLSLIVIMQAVLMVSCIIIQSAYGYTNFELGLYVRWLFGMSFVNYALIAILAMVVQSVVNHKYLGYFLMVVYYLMNIGLPLMGLEQRVYRFGAAPGVIYSDMNGFGHFVLPWLNFKLYWTVFAVILMVLGRLMWVRGIESAWSERFKIARGRLAPLSVGVVAVASIAFLSQGAWIYYNTNVVNTFTPRRQQELDQVRYESELKKHENDPIPKIRSASVRVDLDPAEREAHFEGTLRLENVDERPIEKLYVDIPPGLEIELLDLPMDFTVELDDEDLGVRILALERPIASGESVDLYLKTSVTTPGFRDGGSINQLAANGTFINSGALVPSFTYNAGKEITLERTRRKHDLPERPRMNPIDDLSTRQNTYLGKDGDWIDFEAIVCTAADQTALAPGYLQREWEEDGKRCFEYKMDSPILNFYAFISADYEVARDTWNDVAIEIYYHSGHDWNVERMIRGVKASLEYFSENFSPYQHRQVRIIEFPRYASFAQSFPNTIPFSESIGFIARVEEDDPDDIDYPFYITSHEVAHQWWAHQVIGADCQGSTVLSETLSQYSSLMVMEHEYGTEDMRRFLKFELDRYLFGRSQESQAEQPLETNENQGYIHYRKGSLVMYALKDAVGEEAVNRVLARLIAEHGFKGPPFPVSRDLIAMFKEEMPEHTALIEDLFEKITLFDNRALEASSRKLDDGRWEVTLKAHSAKIYADDQGHETEASLDEMIDVGVLDADGEVLYLEKHRVTEAEPTFTVIVDGEPAKAGLDPFTKLVDRDPDDNTTKIDKEG